MQGICNLDDEHDIKRVSNNVYYFLEQNSDVLKKIKENKFNFDNEEKLEPLKKIVFGNSELMTELRKNPKSFIEEFC